MIEIKTSFSWIKNSNLVFFLERVSDLESLVFLNLDKKILDKIKSSVKKGQKF